MSVDLRPAAGRRRTRTTWLDSAHSFSFGKHYDPDNTGFGVLVAHNDDVLAPGGAFGDHPHRDLEIVTWVLDGELRHADDRGRHGLLPPGSVQRISAGDGIVHSESNASTTTPVHLVQMWVLPDAPGGAPSYEQADVTAGLAGGGLVAVVGGAGAVVGIGQGGVVLWAARLERDERVLLPDARRVHLYVTRGRGRLGGRQVGAGDSVRLTEEGSCSFQADQPVELLVWELPG